MKVVQNAFERGAFHLDAPERDLESALRSALDRAVADGFLPADQEEDVLAAVLAREDEISTAMGHGVACPHAYLDGLEQPLVYFVRLAHPLNMGAPDGVPVRFLILLTGPKDQAAAHLDVLMNLARLMSDEEFRYEAGKAQDSAELLAALHGHLDRNRPEEAAKRETAEDDLDYSGRPFGGIRQDIKRRLPHYLDDFKAGFNSKAVASTLFLFFACLAPAVTFGGLMESQTGGETAGGGQIGVVEMLLASAVCGIAWALFSGQPLIILGGTGPLLVFTYVLYSLCESYGLPFLAVYAWVAIWSAALLFLCAVFDASVLIRYFTRFTDEIFAALISIIFIYEAVSALIAYGRGAGTEELARDAAFLSLLLAFGTFYVAMSLSRFRHSRYLVPAVREFLADFGPTIAVASMVGFMFLFPGVTLDSLNAPEEFGPTQDRSWLISLFPDDMPGWVPIAALGPALLVTVLIFLDQNITARLVNNKDHKLKKGGGYHLDMLLLSVLTLFCGCLGLPIVVAATVRSLNHVRSLASYDEGVSSSGEVKQQINHVCENRLTGLAIHILIALSLLALPYLQYIPRAVLYGLFLYMGVVSIAGNQFFERLTLWVMEPTFYPKTHYLRNVPLKVVHKFTILQVGCLGLLWVVKSSSIPAIAIMFPLFIALLVPVRLLANRWFDEEHLLALDAEEEPEEEESQWV